MVSLNYFLILLLQTVKSETLQWLYLKKNEENDQISATARTFSGCVRGNKKGYI